VNTLDKINLLKESGQDFEWYPTTNEMIAAVFEECKGDSNISMLDIGAGDGRVLERIDKLYFDYYKNKNQWLEFRSSVKKYAIEKAELHIQKMPQDISIVGTDFHLQTLIDKKVDVIFSNPPYLEFEEWAVKIIKEANAENIYLILPARWNNSKLIQQAIKQRKASKKIIWTGDFLESDRSSRAKVDIIQISINPGDRRNSWNNHRDVSNPFDAWFDEYFAGFGSLDHTEDEDLNYSKKKAKFSETVNNLVDGQNLIERLHSLYTAEIKTLLGNYTALSNLDKELLKELGVQISEVKKGLKQKIEGLKNKYWQELFSHLSEITKKLASKSRTEILEKLNASCNVDFNPDNAYAIVIWTIKNANKYINNQLVDIFKELSEPECVKNYKSNQRTWEKDRWRYKQEKNHTHYMLDYRIVSNHCYKAIHNGDYTKWENPNNLHKEAHDFINDIFTIANNLGFSNNANTHHYGDWEAGKAETFYCSTDKILLEVRAFKNGNLHFKFNQDFIKALNIEASRLLGWIKTPEQAVDEMGVELTFARAKFKSNLLIGTIEGRKLLVG
jgi:methylase of polypeptide subunit release factors